MRLTPAVPIVDRINLGIAHGRAGTPGKTSPALVAAVPPSRRRRRPSITTPIGGEEPMPCSPTVSHVRHETARLIVRLELSERDLPRLWSRQGHGRYLTSRNPLLPSFVGHAAHA